MSSDGLFISEVFREFIIANKLIIVCSSYKNGSVIILNGDETINNICYNSFAENRPLSMFVDNQNNLFVSNDLYIKKYVVEKLQDGDLKIMMKTAYFTSDIDIHDIFMKDNEIYFCSSLLNSVCKVTPKEDNNIKLVYTPDFITEKVVEDRCHLNGAALHNNQLYVSCVSNSNIYGGWKYNKRNGGLIINANNGQIILDKLTMPHSPQVYNNMLYFLNSGRGEVCKYNLDTKELTVITFIKGFLRGLSLFTKNNSQLYGLVTCSKDRHENCFRGLELEELIEDYNDVRCGIYLLDLDKIGSDAVIGNVFFDDHYELYDVKTIQTE